MGWGGDGEMDFKQNKTITPLDLIQNSTLEVVFDDFQI